jgi:hypothetical protein
MASVPTKLTKSERALLRELTSEAWEAELGEELEKLFEEFTKWLDHGMSALDLSDRIHEFHKGPARDLYSLYTGAEPAMIAARAIAMGFLDEKSLGDELHSKLAEQIDAFRRLKADE